MDCGGPERDTEQLKVYRHLILNVMSMSLECTPNQSMPLDENFLSCVFNKWPFSGERNVVTGN